MTDAPTAALSDIRSTVETALLKHGASPRIAASVAKATTESEERGNTICGLAYVESYCTQLATGRVDGTVDPVVNHDRPAAVRVDAKFGFAQPAFEAGIDQAVTAAKELGIAALSIEHSHTCTSLGYFTEQLARQDVVAIGYTNATPRVAPPGGDTALLGTNPIAMSVPDGDGGIAFQFDFATSAVALGTVLVAAKNDEPIPLGWAVDSSGEPTTNAKAALEGSLQSMGGYKGYGIGLMVEVLAAALTGTNLSTDVPPLKTPEGAPHDLGQFYVLIDPNSFSGPVFTEKIAAMVAAVEAQEGARLPGRSLRHIDPVPVNPAVWDTVCGLAD